MLMPGGLGEYTLYHGCAGEGKVPHSLQGILPTAGRFSVLPLNGSEKETARRSFLVSNLHAPEHRTYSKCGYHNNG